MEAGFARGWGVGVGDEVKLSTRVSGTARGTLYKPFRIAGLLSPQGAAGFKQGSIVFLPLETAEAMFRKAGNINPISVVVADGADENAVAEPSGKFYPRACRSARRPSDRSSPRKRSKRCRRDWTSPM